MPNQQQMESLLLLYCNNELDAAQARQVKEWIAASPENTKLARDIYYITFSADTLRSMKSVHAEQALKRVHHRIGIARRRVLIGYFQRVAALLVVPLMIAAAFYAGEYYLRDIPGFVEVRTTTGMITSVTLPDSSKVWLNSNTTLRYPTCFQGANRSVELIGEAYFSVKKSAGRKFLVNTQSMQIEVLGTEFNVDAYGGTGRDIRTTLVSGSVQMVYQGTDNLKHVVRMRPNEQLSFNPEQRSIRCALTSVRSASSWKDGKIILDKTSLSDALRMIENRYNVEFVIRNTALRENRYTGMFVNQRLEIILEHFRRTTNIRFNRLDTPTADVVTGREIIEVY